MLSTPVCGVETKNDTVEPFDAPDSLRVAATGMTPHEQRGRGIPNNVDFNMEMRSFEPICL